MTFLSSISKSSQLPSTAEQDAQEFLQHMLQILAAILRPKGFDDEGVSYAGTFWKKLMKWEGVVGTAVKCFNCQTYVFKLMPEFCF